MHLFLIVLFGVMSIPYNRRMFSRLNYPLGPASYIIWGRIEAIFLLGSNSIKDHWMYILLSALTVCSYGWLKEFY
jgi:hypothetical protein